MASIVVCLLTKPEEDEVLKSFYRTVRPWGFWGPIYEKCRAEDPTIQKNRDFWRDMFNIAVGLVWQTSLVAGPIYLVIQHWTARCGSAGRVRRDLADPEVHLVRQARAGSAVSRQVPESARPSGLPRARRHP